MKIRLRPLLYFYSKLAGGYWSYADGLTHRNWLCTWFFSDGWTLINGYSLRIRSNGFSLDDWTWTGFTWTWIGLTWIIGLGLV